MSVPRNMFKELVDRKLWPIALVLVIALVAVPVLLTKKAPTDIVTPPSGPLPYSSGTTLPAISVQTAPGNSNLGGKGRNPFTPQHVATTSTTAVVASVTTPSTGTTTTSTGSTGVSSTGTSGGSGTSSSTSSSSSGSTPAPTSTTPAPAPKPAPIGLTSTQAYHVSLAITTANGGVNTIDPLERLSILPSKQEPMLIDLGVLQGGHSVVFVVEPGTVVSGAGTCTPGPIDCEILTLNPGQTEGISRQTASGSTPVALFSVNSISADQFPSAAAANKARTTASDVGRQLLSRSPLSAISLFQYDPSVGAVVDLRNLTVGG
ncbi:MAG TPA: hypothetical protein VMA96_13195 [Solirubrobacteraceae bacterium]|nr:hypothetical protein [Solirubrobacteraceae bacterium]